jgi:hypothetical protein
MPRRSTVLPATMPIPPHALLIKKDRTEKL